MHEDISLTSETDYDPYIKMHSRALEGSSANARLFLWKLEQYNKQLSNSAITTIEEAPKWEWADIMTQGIDNFLYNYDTKEGTPYNTNQTWPDDNTTYYASGIGPDDAYDWDDTNSSYEDGVTLRDNIILRADMRDGSAELVASINDGTSRGKSAEPFVEIGEDTKTADYNEERELKFHHLTSNISFKGKRSVNMSNRIGVKNVRITINNKGKNGNANSSLIAIPASIRRHVGTNIPKVGDTQLEQRSAWTYVVGETEKPDAISKTSAEKIEMTLKPEDPPVDLMDFYVLSDGINYGTKTDGSNATFDPFDPVVAVSDTKPTLDISIYAEYFLTDNEKEVRCIQWNHVLIQGDAWSVVNGADPTGDKFMPAHKYEVTLTFDSEAVALRAELVPWVEEKPVYIPVWGTTPTSLLIQINNEYTTDETPVVKQLMYTPDNNLYGVIVDLQQGQYISFFSYDNSGNKQIETLDEGYDYSYDELIVNTTDGNGDPINNDNMVQFVGGEGTYVIRLDKTRKKIFCIPYTETNYGIYLNEVKLSEGPYMNCYGTHDMVYLEPYDNNSNPEQYHLSRLDENGEEFLSLAEFRYDANHFSYNAPSKGLIFKGTAGYYHIVYDEETNNIASMLIALGHDNTGYTDIQDGYYFGRHQLVSHVDGNENVFKYETDALSYDDIISISRITADVVNEATSPAITVSKFYEGTEPAAENGIVYWTVAEGSKSFFHIETDGSLRFRPKGSKLHSFTIDTQNKVISCQYLSDSFRNAYSLNGGTPVKASAFNKTQLVVDLNQDNATAELSIVYYGDDYQASVIDLTSTSVSFVQFDEADVMEAADATHVRLKSGAKKGYYKLAFNFTGATGTITPTRVRNAQGDPLPNEWYVNNNKVDGTYYCMFVNNDWGPGNEVALVIAHDEGDGAEVQDYTSWVDANAPFAANSGHTALVLKNGMATGKYIVHINVGETKSISGYCLNGDQTLWEGSQQISTQWTDAVKTCYSTEQLAKWSTANENEKIIITVNNVNDGNCKYDLCYNNNDGWQRFVQDHTMEQGTTQIEYTIGSDQLNNIRSGGLVITGSGGYYITKVELIRNN